MWGPIQQGPEERVRRKKCRSYAGKGNLEWKKERRLTNSQKTYDIANVKFY